MSHSGVMDPSSGQRGKGRGGLRGGLGERGVVILEYLLLLGGIILPLTPLPFYIMRKIGMFYDRVAAGVCSPFP